MDDIALKLNITDPSGWYNVNTTAIMKEGGTSILSNKYNSSLINLLKAVYPEYLLAIN